MKTASNRLRRQDRSRPERAPSERRGERARYASLLVVLFVLALTPGSAAAITGGAPTLAASEAQLGGLAFTPVQWAGATWYGPGFYGNRTACGQVLRPLTIGVAHRSLPCGTAVKFLHGERQIVTRVIDRGPFSQGNSWDLTNGARRALGFEGSGPIRYAVSVEYALGARPSRRPRG